MKKYFKNITSEDELKKLYRELANEFHPDKPTGDIKVFQEIQKQYEEILIYFRISKEIQPTEKQPAKPKKQKQKVFLSEELQNEIKDSAAKIASSTVQAVMENVFSRFFTSK